MKIWTKLTLSYLALTCLVVAIGWAGLDAIRTIGGMFNAVLDSSDREVIALQSIQTGIFRLQMEVLSATDAQEEIADGEGEESVQELAEERKEFLAAVKEIEENLTIYANADPSNKDDALKIEPLVRRYHQIGLVQMGMGGHNFDKKASEQNLDSLEVTEGEFEAIMKVLLQKKYDDFKSAGLSANKVAYWHWILSITMISGAVLFALVIGFLMARSISSPIRILSDATEEIAGGNFEVRTHLDRSDEFGNLGQRFNQMVAELAQAKILKKQQAELKLLNQELEKKNEALDSFVYRVSHDLKAPVVNIVSLVNLLRTKWQPYDKRQELAFGHLNNSAEKLQQTIYDLLEVSRLERNLAKEVESIDFENIMNTVEQNVRNQIAQSGALILKDFEVAPSFSFVRLDLESILTNLLTNSIKYRKPDIKPIIKFRAIAAHPFICLTVTDNGLGIDLEKYRDKLFGMFMRFHGHVEGSGVGLYIVHRLVVGAGGRIEVESKVNQGTTFRLFLPLQPEQNEEMCQTTENRVLQKA